MSSALTAALTAAALAKAAELLGYEAVDLFEPVRDGRGRVRLLAGGALLDADLRPVRAVAAALALNPSQLTPSNFIDKDLTAEMVAAVQAVIQAHVEPEGPPSSAIPPAAPKRNERGWVDCRRNVVREARIVEARLNGEGPKAIAEREGVSLNTVKNALIRSGKTFERLRSGRPAQPKPEKVERVRAAPKPRVPKVARPKAPPRPKPVPRPQVIAPPVVQAEPFPANHPAWAPLPGSSPVRLIDHTRGCRWPVTVDAPAPHVCDLPTKGETYCPRHRWLALPVDKRPARPPLPHASLDTAA